MNQPSGADRRVHQRFPLATNLSFHHGPTQRDFPGRSVDVSHGGMLMYVPATVPLHAGQYLRVSLGGTPGAEFVGLNDEPVEATVVRVDRNPLVAAGHIAVGVQFNRPAT